MKDKIIVKCYIGVCRVSVGGEVDVTNDSSRGVLRGCRLRVYDPHDCPGMHQVQGSKDSG